MLLVNAVNTEGRPLEIFVKDGRIAAVSQELKTQAAATEPDKAAAPRALSTLWTSRPADAPLPPVATPL